MKKVIRIMIIIFVILTVTIFGINFFIKSSTKKQILTEKQASNLEDIDCILVLGAGIWGNRPSHMLEDRILTAISLYQNNISTKIIMSGDHGREEYDEVNIMKDFAIENGIPSENIFMDHAGFSSYESI